MDIEVVQIGSFVVGFVVLIILHELVSLIFCRNSVNQYLLHYIFNQNSLALEFQRQKSMV